MWAILSAILGYGGTAAAGWAVSDWFNERNETKQAEANEQPKTVWNFLSKNWVKWIVGAVVVGLVAFFSMRLIKKNK